MNYCELPTNSLDYHLYNNPKLYTTLPQNSYNSNDFLTCASPIVVVLFPSPKGVGVTPTTTIYFPSGLF